MDFANTTLSEAATLKVQAIQQLAFDYANSAAAFAVYAPLWADGFTPAIQDMLNFMPPKLDAACQSVGLGTYLQTIGQAPTYTSIQPNPPIPTPTWDANGVLIVQNANSNATADTSNSVA